MLLARADAVFSLWKPDSPMSRLRRSDITLADAPAEICEVLERCAEALAASGLDRTCRLAFERGLPFLGICVGFQLLFEGSEEAPGVPGLGIVGGRGIHRARRRGY